MDLCIKLLVSQFVYAFAEVRSLINEHDDKRRLKDFSNSKSSRSKSSQEELVDFRKTDLVMTHEEFQKDHAVTAYLNKAIHFTDVLEFLKANRNNLYFDEQNCINLRSSLERERSSDSFFPSTIESQLNKLCRRIDADIWEFDDEFSEEELVFSIIVNRYAFAFASVFPFWV